MTGVIAVTGASGFFGRALEAQLAPRGRLRGLFRAHSAVSEHWRTRGHELVFGDLASETALAALVDGADVVYHLAARMSKGDPEESRRVNVEGTRRLAHLAREARVRRLIYVSSISVYAATRPPSHIVTEECRPTGVGRLNPYSRTKYEGEEVVRRLAREGRGPAYTVVRPTNVYGPWGRSWFLDWVRRLERMPVVIGGDIPADLVHVDDVATALIRAAESEAAAGETLHIGHETLSVADFAIRVGASIGRKVYRLPGPVDHLARVAIERGHLVLRGNLKSMSLTWPVSYPHTKAAEMIGYAPRISVEEGLESLGRWYREETGVWARPPRSK